MKITEIAQNFMKKVGVIRNTAPNASNVVSDMDVGLESDNRADWVQQDEYDMDAEIDRRDAELEMKMERESWEIELEELSEGLGKDDKAALSKEIEEKGYSKLAESKEIDDLYTWSRQQREELGIDEEEEEILINERFGNKRKEIAQQFREKVKIEKIEKVSERVAERVAEKIREKDKLEKGRSIKAKLNEVKKEIKPNRVINQTDQSKKSDRSRKNTQINKQQAKHRSKKSGLSLSM